MLKLTSFAGVLCLILLTPGIPAAADTLPETETLQQRLVRLDSLRSGVSTQFDVVEQQGEELLARYRSRQDRAKIYYQLAEIYAQSGINRTYLKVGQYGRLALASLSDPVRKATLSIYLGDAAQMDDRTTGLEARRTRATMVYLTGYRELLRYNLPDVAPELPMVGMYDVDGPPAEMERVRKLHDRQMQAHEEAKFQRQMIALRTILLRQISNLYTKPPVNRAELAEIAHRILKDRRAEIEFLARCN